MEKQRSRHLRPWEAQLTGSAKKNSRRGTSLCARKPAPKEDRKRSVTPSEEFSELKILNIGQDQADYLFFEICSAFKEALQGLSLSGNTHRIHEELTAVLELIEEKISFLERSRARKNSLSSVKSAGFRASDLSLSMQSLCSEKSSHEDRESPACFERFMTSVNCPFCSEIQSDVTSFVKHLDKSCLPHLTKILKKESGFPFASFQILPNNTFKCNICSNAVQQNLRNFFVHMQSELHLHNFAKATRWKNHDTSLFCSCCKVLVYNNYIQISCHINHEIHKTKREQKKPSKYFLSKGIHCVFTQSKKFKCLVCPSAYGMFTTVRAALEHFEDAVHKRHKKNDVLHSSVIYCEVCSEDVHMHKIINHFGSSLHNANDKSQREKSFEICFCCHSVCESLLALSFHMDSHCDAINKIRAKIPKETEPKKEAGTEAGIAKGPCIVVKNCREIPELYRYFRKFGEIVAIESPNDGDVVVEFREKTTVDDILLLRDVLTVAGTKLDIAVDLEGGESVEKVDGKEESENEASDTSSKSEGCTDEDDAEVMTQDKELDDLFGRVSKYLTNISQKLISAEEEKIRLDCMQTLRIEKCSFVGFSGAGLSFFHEGVNLFCELEENVFEKILSPYIPPLNNSQAFAANLLKATFKTLSGSELWKNVEQSPTPGPYSCLKCVHKETQRACTITFARSASVLTDMLGECMEKSQLVKPFCMIIRFWLTIHELKIHNFELALISFLVFFLINTKVATLSEGKYGDCGVHSALGAGKIEAHEDSAQSKRPIANVKELFQKFMLFTSTFDFDKYAICLPSPTPLPKSVLRSSKLDLLFDVKDPGRLHACDMCILDPILCVNLAEDVQESDKEKFLEVVRATVGHYKIK